MPIAAALLCDDDVRPLLLFGRKKQSADVEVADTRAAFAFFDDDIQGCLCLCDDRRVIVTRERDDVVSVICLLLQCADEVNVCLCGAAQEQS